MLIVAVQTAGAPVPVPDTVVTDPILSLIKLNDHFSPKIAVTLPLIVIGVGTNVA